MSACRCTFQNNAEEGAVVMDAASAAFSRCQILGNSGPGIDVSFSGKVDVQDCLLSGNVGKPLAIFHACMKSLVQLVCCELVAIGI